MLTEYEEACNLADTLRAMNIDFYHMPQETFTKSWGVKMKNKRQGVRKGVSDYMVYLPATRSKTKKAIILWVELKKARRLKKNGKLGGVMGYPTTEQLEFIEKMNTVNNIQGTVANGAEEALDYVKSFLI